MAELMIGRRDMTEDGVRKDAEAQLRRAEMGGGDAALAQWARDWGRAALVALDVADARLCNTFGFGPWN